VSGDRLWRARPMLSFALRLGALMVPTAAAVVVVAVLGHLAPAPTGPSKIGWIVWLFAVATIVAWGVERLARRVLPLAVLFQLSLAFPDRAPSRFKMARVSGNVRRLEERIERANEVGVDDDPAVAARQILELVAALSAHDRKTRGHSERVRAYTDMLADELGLGDEDRDRLRWAALLHDIGKLQVPAKILNKPSKPDAHEWERLKGHPAAGERIAAPLLPWLGTWATAIIHHHERFDGRGYPSGLTAAAISTGGRIVAVADSFEVMTSARAYKKPMTVSAARRELARCAGSQFDPDMVRAFLSISLGRLWWTVGPASWVAVTPIIGWLSRSSAEIAIAAKGATVAAALSVGGAIQLANAAPGAPVQPGQASSSPVSDPTLTPTPDAPDGSGGASTSSGSDPVTGQEPGDGQDPGGEDPSVSVEPSPTGDVSHNVDPTDPTPSGSIVDPVQTVVDTVDSVTATPIPSVKDPVPSTIDTITSPVSSRSDV
jgi:putative nucleotidyltransferase with HDIG domain